jgi:uncharacterized protein YfiM (DUF2279 family)
LNTVCREICEIFGRYRPESELLFQVQGSFPATWIRAGAGRLVSQGSEWKDGYRAPEGRAYASVALSSSKVLVPSSAATSSAVPD